ncbi:MAG: HDIG domain-containing protein [Opitutales bacterium]|nr:HDIG domain-containing protein [Opitutales bacterium]
MAQANTRKEGPGTQIRKRIAEQTRKQELLSRSNLSYALIFVIFAFILIEICFSGLSPAGPQVLRGQIARSRITSELSFRYVSGIETARAREEIRARTPPVYSLSQDKLLQFREWLFNTDELLTGYLSSPVMDEQVSSGPQKGLLKVTPEEMDAFLKTVPGGNRFNLNGEDLAALTNTLGHEERQQALEEGLRILADLYRQGIYDEAQNPVRSTGGSMSFLKIENENGDIVQAEVLSEEQAISDLKINLSSLDIPRNAFLALFRVMRAGLQPNLVFDQQRTDAIVDEAVRNMEPRTVSVSLGETIIEPGLKVSDLQYEQLQAYRQKLREGGNGTSTDNQFFDRALLALATVFALAIFLRMQRRNRRAHLRELVLAGITVVLNLVLVRMMISLGEGSLGQSMPTLALILPWLAPIALGPILIAILMGSGAGAITAGLVAVFNGLMQGGSMAITLATLLTGLAGVYACRNVQVRTRVVRAGLMSGLMLGFFALVFSLRDGAANPTDILWILLISQLNGFLTGVIAVGLLPIFENLFRHTTDITLLELTDFNHPLLRRMQVNAPGSYHHSLMVANLAENAAMRIGANPLICRAAALYHDIGKIIKPEYFIENQRDGNPHMERNPSMSALIIKAHVKEGVALAKQYHLPRVVMDIIQQHHGTSLIQYFYYMALKRQNDVNATLYAPPGACKVELDEVTQSTYRYEGPRPQFAESAIVMLADTMEAASRSLKKVTPQSIEDFVNNIVKGRIEDGQLDEAPITMNQINLMKESFIFTLLNMLHSRIEYPKGEPQKKPAPRAPQTPEAVAKEEAGAADKSAKPEATDGTDAQTNAPASSEVLASGNGKAKTADDAKTA